VVEDMFTAYPDDRNVLDGGHIVDFVANSIDLVALRWEKALGGENCLMFFMLSVSAVCVCARIGFRHEAHLYPSGRPGPPSIGNPNWLDDIDDDDWRSRIAHPRQTNQEA
jgi:hypothetical protein